MHHSPSSENESPVVKFLISGTVSWTFELLIGHYLEFLKIAKQTSTLSYAQITKNMIQHKGIVGILDGYFPWGSIQCFIKGAAFGFGQTLGYNALKDHTDNFTAEVLSGGIGGGFQGLVMSPLLLLKTRVMTMPEMRQSGGVVQTTIASTRVGMSVIQREGLQTLFKGSLLFSSKRVADWSSRFLFAELCSNALKHYKHTDKLTVTEKTAASLAGGALSATVTLPIDVLVATFQDASKAGQKMSVVGVLREKVQQGGVSGLVQFSTRGYTARLLHVGATTALMKTISSAVYAAYDKIGQKPQARPMH